MEHRTDLRNASTSFLHLHSFLDRARDTSRERSRGQLGTIEIGPAEPRELNALGSHDGFAGVHPGGIREGFQPGIEIGVELRVIPSSVRKDLRRRKRLSGTRWALQSQLLHDLERGVQWIA